MWWFLVFFLGLNLDLHYMVQVTQFHFSPPSQLGTGWICDMCTNKVHEMGYCQMAFMPPSCVEINHI